VRIVVTGGTGFVGRALVTSLAERGDDVVVLTRGASPASAPGPRRQCCRGAGRVELVQWTPEQPGAWMGSIDGADAVVNLAGAGLVDERWTPERQEVLRSSRIRATELVAEAIANAERKPRVLVSGSAAGYYGIASGDRVLDEDAAPGDDFLARLTSDWEKAADRAREAGVRVCHPRMGLVLGNGGGMLARLLPLFNAYVGGPIGDGAQYVPWIHQVDAIRALEHGIREDSCGGAYDVTAPEPVTMNDFAHELGVALGRPSSLRVPAMAVRLALGPAADVVLSGQRAIPKRLVGAGFAFVFPDLSSALADLVGEHAAV
jgi:uncharacterized protein (TIGR01777 family)